MRFRFDCVFYYVSDLQRSLRFYTDVLGFRLVSQDVVARFDVDGVLFELVPNQEKASLQAAGNARLCLQVDHLAEAMAELQSKGVHTTETQIKEGGMLSSLEDPDGNEICLWEYSRP